MTVFGKLTEADAGHVAGAADMDTLIASLRRLIGQSTEALGAEHPSTLMLKQQLAAALAAQDPRPRVFWLKPAPPSPPEPGN